MLDAHNDFNLAQSSFTSSAFAACVIIFIVEQYFTYIIFPVNRRREAMHRQKTVRTRSGWGMTADQKRRPFFALIDDWRLGSARLGSARLGSARLGSARLG